ncbi:RTA1 like protein-domain-containing protein [Lentinula edodes]|uniref:RTA1 like protein-domain-containing protein n=1 Tax=Lentinula lateritia TaxID=40482 RepID=A0A9W9B0D2_9AGAR|nr:RTA1 like protein-domain-containing protein [Lentinula edodes]
MSTESSLSEHPYNYTPTEYITILFLVLFSVSFGRSQPLHLPSLSQQMTFRTLLQCFIPARLSTFRTWWTIPTMVFAGLLEVLGWSARLWSSKSPSLLSPYEMQLTCTILAPTPLLAGNFIILGSMIQQLGPKYSRIPPWWYTIIFCSFDLTSLLAQAVGGGMVATAVGKGKDPTPGGHVMLGGIVFQMATITVYILFASEFFIRYFNDKPLNRIQKRRCFFRLDEKPNPEESSVETVFNEVHHRDSGSRGAMDFELEIMSAALVLSTICIFIRAVYRTIELTDGWSGRIISTQRYFNVLDGAMIVIAMYIMNIAHPALLLDTNLNEFADVIRYLCARVLQ